IIRVVHLLLFKEARQTYKKALLVGSAAGRDQLRLLVAAQRENAVRRKIVMHCQAQLFEIIGALRSTCRLACCLDCGQQQGNQHRDYGDDDQKLDQGKAMTRFALEHRFLLAFLLVRDGKSGTDRKRERVELRWRDWQTAREAASSRRSVCVAGTSSEPFV